ncbi:hypothetical protein BDU57DRAFT_510857 [Ampelomyces quisqualis]|uniref:Uncharacterized protein n=1 Tax=Ampelomyces quisqualis TaxID=50730 RepID=A0A6A5R3U5_AMPQU|nr:hypothetical protein BDU57DRAFT_510857 [Ampelomyces quisqualis]
MNPPPPPPATHVLMGATWDFPASTPTTKYELKGKPSGYFLTRASALQYMLDTCMRTNSQGAIIFRDKSGRMYGFARWFPDKGWGLGYWIDSGVVPHAERAVENMTFAGVHDVR